MYKNNQVEIMAPVGSFEALRAAIQAGADSVYFGVEQLNMRARSSINFTIEDLKTIVELCDSNHVKSYLTLNTILYNHDIPLMKSIVDAAKNNGISAMITMDHAAIAYANSIGLPVHISTQINITNIETLKFYAKFADVVVLSRELTISQVAEICEQVKEQNVLGPAGELVRVEVFVHGALCMAVSGKCYLSLHTANSSANRGACKQNCRRKYTVTDDEGNELLIDNEYIMSPKDLNTIGFLDTLIETGVSVLKIEGRGKSADYVLEAVSCYKEASIAVAEGTFDEAKVEDWNERLSNVYNRGFWGGYFMGKKLGEWTDSHGSKAKQRKTFLGKGIKFYANIAVGEFKLQAGDIKVGDEIIITGPTTGIFKMEVKELRVENKSVQEHSNRGVHFSMPLPEKIRPSDKLYKIVPA